MNTKRVWIAAAAAFAMVGCAPSAESEEAPTDTGGVAEESEAPAETPAIGATDDLLALSCADFLATAAVALDEEDEEAALSAQDEIASGLIWVHGYLFAKEDGEIPVLSQNWIESTAKRIHETCMAAEDPTALNLFEVASHEGA